MSVMLYVSPLVYLFLIYLGSLSIVPGWKYLAGKHFRLNALMAAFLLSPVSLILHDKEYSLTTSIISQGGLGFRATTIQDLDLWC